MDPVVRKISNNVVLGSRTSYHQAGRSPQPSWISSHVPVASRRCCPALSLLVHISPGDVAVGLWVTEQGEARQQLCWSVLPSHVGVLTLTHTDCKGTSRPHCESLAHTKDSVGPEHGESLGLPPPSAFTRCFHPHSAPVPLSFPTFTSY